MEVGNNTTEQKQSTFLEDWLELDRAFSSGSGDEEIGTGFSSQKSLNN
jgi:hypothetical protein